MSNKVISMHQIRSIIQYLQEGYSLRAMSRALHMSRKTITQYSERLKNHSMSLEQLRSLSDAELSVIVYSPVEPPAEDVRRIDLLARVDYLLKELSRTGVTRLLLWQEYIKEYPEGYGYSQFCSLLCQQQKVSSPSMRMTYQPGEVMMIDWAGDPLYYTDRSTGELIPCPVLVCVLPYSGYSFVRALADATLERLINTLNDCLSFLGGVPRGLKTDNMRQIVVKTSRYEPTLTDAVNEWAQHNNICITTTRVARPKDYVNKNIM